MMFLIPLLALGAALFGGNKRPAPSSPSSPSSTTSSTRPTYDPKADTQPRPVPESRALVTTTRPSSPAEKPAQPAEKKPVQLVPQPKGATGNLPNETRPLGTSNFSPEEAHKLAPAVVASLRTKPRESKAIVAEFQRKADLQPVDGVYGPRTAGALAFYAPRSDAAVSVPLPFTPDKRIIPYRI